jgi:hypothetical protein
LGADYRKLLRVDMSKLDILRTRGSPAGQLHLLLREIKMLVTDARFTDLSSVITSRNSMKNTPSNRDLWKDLRAPVSATLKACDSRGTMTITERNMATENGHSVAEKTVEKFLACVVQRYERGKPSGSPLLGSDVYFS